MAISKRYKTALSLLCLFVVAARLTGVHEHLCLDGSEPPVSLHFWDDTGLHHARDAEARGRNKHTDIDVSVAGDLVAKRYSGSFDLPVLPAANVFSMAFTAVDFRIDYDETQCAFGVTDCYLHPPLRAPPRISPVV